MEQTKENTQQLIKELAGMEAANQQHLSKQELVQIINFGPTSDAEVYLLLDNCEERFDTEQIKHILHLVSTYLTS